MSMLPTTSEKNSAIAKEDISVRACRPEDVIAWKIFLDRNFGYVAPQSYATDFAPLFEERELENSLLVWVGKQIAACATLYVPEGSKIGIIGAVATDDAFRNQGFSRHLIESLENSARKRALEGIILWSEKAEFYDRLGFVPVGLQRIYILAGGEPKSTLVQTLSKAGKTFSGKSQRRAKLQKTWDVAQVAKLHARHRLGITRTKGAWERLQKITSCERRQWVSAAGEVQAYLGFHRGKDLQNIIHEWGGEPAALRLLVAEVLREEPQLLWLTHPGLEDPILEFLSPDALVHESHLALAKFFKAQKTTNLWFWGLDSM